MIFSIKFLFFFFIVTKFISFRKRSPVNSVCELKPLCKRRLCRKILRENFLFMHGLQTGTMTIESETNDSAQGFSACHTISVVVRNSLKEHYLTAKKAFYCPEFLIMLNNALKLSMPFYITSGNVPNSAFFLKGSGLYKRKDSYGQLWFYGTDLKYEKGFKTGCMPPKFR